MNRSRLSAVLAVAIGAAVALTACSTDTVDPSSSGAAVESGTAAGSGTTAESETAAESGTPVESGGGVESETAVESGTTVESGSERRVFDPRSDEYEVTTDDLVFADPQAEATFAAIRSGATSVADDAGMQHLARSYGGGNYIVETWCSADTVSPDECETGREPRQPGWSTIRHNLFTYDGDFTLPKRVEKQQLAVQSTDADPQAWGLTAEVDYDEQGTGVLQADLHRPGPGSDATAEGETVSVGGATKLRLTVSDGDRRISGGAVQLDVTDDLATQLRTFTISADSLRTGQLEVLDALQRKADQLIATGKFEVCIQQDALHSGGWTSAPAPPCDATEPTAADTAALQQQSDAWFDGQRELLTSEADQIFETLTAAYPWEVLAG